MQEGHTVRNCFAVLAAIENPQAPQFGHTGIGRKLFIGTLTSYQAARLITGRPRRRWPVLDTRYIRRGPRVLIFSAPIPKSCAAAYGSVNSGKLPLCPFRRRSCISVCSRCLYRNIWRTKTHATPSRTADTDRVLEVSCSLPFLTRHPPSATN